MTPLPSSSPVLTNPNDSSPISTHDSAQDQAQMLTIPTAKTSTSDKIQSAKLSLLDPSQSIRDSAAKDALSPPIPISLSKQNSPKNLTMALAANATLDDTSIHQSTSANASRNVDEKILEYSPNGRYAKLNCILGKGAYKIVWKALDLEDGLEVAWNCFQTTKHESSEYSQEIDILKKVRHPNIISYRDSWYMNGEFIFISELMTSGTIREYMKKLGKPTIKVIKNWTRQILKGLLYMHSHQPPILHRDIKCDNIFINGGHGEVKIGDLGTAQMKVGKKYTVIGTPEFMAPEMYEEKGYSEKVDVYAFGMCLLELVTGEYPYSECKNAAQIYKKVSSGAKPDCLQSVEDEDIKSLIEACLAPETSRLTVKDIFDHPFYMCDPEVVLLSVDEPRLALTIQVSFRENKHRMCVKFEYSLESDTPENVVDEMIQENVLPECNKSFVIHEMQRIIRDFHIRFPFAMELLQYKKMNDSKLARSQSQSTSDSSKNSPSDSNSSPLPIPEPIAEQEDSSQKDPPIPIQTSNIYQLYPRTVSSSSVLSSTPSATVSDSLQYGTNKDVPQSAAYSPSSLAWKRESQYRYELEKTQKEMANVYDKWIAAESKAIEMESKIKEGEQKRTDTDQVINNLMKELSLLREQMGRTQPSVSPSSTNLTSPGMTSQGSSQLNQPQTNIQTQQQSLYTLQGTPQVPTYNNIGTYYGHQENQVAPPNQHSLPPTQHQHTTSLIHHPQNSAVSGHSFHSQSNIQDPLHSLQSYPKQIDNSTFITNVVDPRYSTPIESNPYPSGGSYQGHHPMTINSSATYGGNIPVMSTMLPGTTGHVSRNSFHASNYYANTESSGSHVGSAPSGQVFPQQQHIHQQQPLPIPGSLPSNSTAANSGQQRHPPIMNAAGIHISNPSLTSLPSDARNILSNQIADNRILQSGNPDSRTMHATQGQGSAVFSPPAGTHSSSNSLNGSQLPTSPPMAQLYSPPLPAVPSGNAPVYYSAQNEFGTTNEYNATNSLSANSVPNLSPYNAAVSSLPPQLSNPSSSPNLIFPNANKPTNSQTPSLSPSMPLAYNPNDSITYVAKGENTRTSNASMTSISQSSSFQSFDGMSLQDFVFFVASQNHRGTDKATEWLHRLQEQDIQRVSDLKKLHEEDWANLSLTVFACRALRNALKHELTDKSSRSEDLSRNFKDEDKIDRSEGTQNPNYNVDVNLHSASSVPESQREKRSASTASNVTSGCNTPLAEKMAQVSLSQEHTAEETIHSSCSEMHFMHQSSSSCESLPSRRGSPSNIAAVPTEAANTAITP